MQRQRLPIIQSRTCSGPGAGHSASSAVAATTWPGVQMPHWKPPQLEEGLLHRRQPAVVVRQALDRGDLAALDRADRAAGRPHISLPVDQDAAGAADADAAALLGAGEPEVLTQHVEDRTGRRGDDLPLRPVDAQGDALAVVHGPIFARGLMV